MQFCHAKKFDAVGYAKLQATVVAVEKFVYNCKSLTPPGVQEIS